MKVRWVVVQIYFAVIRSLLSNLRISTQTKAEVEADVTGVEVNFLDTIGNALVPELLDGDTLDFAVVTQRIENGDVKICDKYHCDGDDQV